MMRQIYSFLLAHGSTAVLMAACFVVACAAPQSFLQAQDDPPAIRFARDLTFAHVEGKLFRSVNVYKTGWREAMMSLRVRIHEHKLKRKWLNVEIRAFQRLAGHIDTELEAVSAARKNLRTSSLAAAQFSNGDDWPTKRGGFIKLLRQVGHTDEARAMLQQHADPLPADSFSNHDFLEIVDVDGNLFEPPKTLTDRSKDGRGIELFREFRDEWRQAVTALKQGQLVGSQRTDRMHSLLKEWDGVRDSIRGVPSVASTVYLERAGLLVNTMENTEGRMQLGDFLREKGHRFRGNTVGEMMRHILEHDLVVVPGSTAHIALGTVTDALIEVAEAEAEELTARIEVLKAQSPSHNAALRQKLIPLHLQESSGKNAGMDSPAFSKLPKSPTTAKDEE